MVKYFLVKVHKDWYATNKDALKKFGNKPVCVFKVNKLVQENQRLIEELREKTLDYDEKIRLLDDAKAILDEAKAILEEAEAINAKRKVLLEDSLYKKNNINNEKINHNSKN